MSVTIYHNSRCSKSRQTLALLEEKGIQPDVVAYLETPPSADTLRTLLGQLGFDSPRQMMRTKEAIYKELQLADATDEQLIQAMVENPKLIERPIVVANGKAAMGRPPENVLTIL
ncbi:Arsenate reductase [Grimontia celer]|uniref:Arsenate reductase n=1 Tax=Grimontia celer TaxID=1796497 RepID=A0A128F2E1_9GAMM|nr:arsenate reductase (glutaredoxin) [Grimontia celer]CZF80416.1 Arsenate reductase [Grimontia celer]